MKNACFGLLASLFCFSLFAYRSLPWAPVNLDSRVSVMLPTNLKEQALPEPLHMLKAWDNTGSYVAIHSPIEADYQGKERKEYYDSIIEGMEQSNGVKVLCHSTCQVDKYDGIDLIITVTSPEKQQTSAFFIRCLIIDKKFYNLQFIPGHPGENSEAQSKRYFNSITLH